MSSQTPVCVFVLSGKRKCGKDFISEALLEKIGKDRCSILRLSGPLKKQYALENGLDFQRLLDASAYKETYRAAMITWGEEKRIQDPGFFCRLATSGNGSEKAVWIISDARRKSDVQYFKTNYSSVTVTVHIEADEEVRKDRGFVFTTGIDDVESECGLDGIEDWDIVIKNNGDEQLFNEAISILLKHTQGSPD